MKKLFLLLFVSILCICASNAQGTIGGIQAGTQNYPTICIFESAWEDGFSNGKALCIYDNLMTLSMDDTNIWDIRQWVKLTKNGLTRNPYKLDMFASCGNVCDDVSISSINNWNTLYDSKKSAYNVYAYDEVNRQNIYFCAAEDANGNVSIANMSSAATATSNKQAAWYIITISQESLNYVYDMDFVRVMAEFGKIMPVAKYYYETAEKGDLVYVSANGLEKSSFDALYNTLNIYYQKGPAEVVKMAQTEQVTPVADLMARASELKEHFGNFVSSLGYFRLLSEKSDSYLVSQPDGTFLMLDIDDSSESSVDIELKSIFYAKPSAELSCMNMLSYEDGRYVQVNGTALAYARIPIDGEKYNYHALTASQGSGNVKLGDYYLGVKNSNIELLSKATGKNCKWNVEKVDELPVVISSVKFATFYSPMELQLPVGVAAYVVYAEGKSSGLDYNLSTGDVVGQDVNVFNVKQLKGSVIPAGMPVVLHAEDAGTYYFKINYIPTVVGDDAREAVYNDGDDDAVNLLQGRHEATYIPEAAGYTHYVLANKDKGVGMYKVATNSLHTSKDGVVTSFATPSFYNNAHRAWLPMPNSISQRANGYLFSLGRLPGTTDIEENVAVEVAEDVIYDLQGRRLNSITVPGVYIVNGKRVFVK